MEEAIGEEEKMKRKIITSIEIFGRFIISLGAAVGLDSLNKGIIFTVIGGITLIVWTALPILNRGRK